MTTPAESVHSSDSWSQLPRPPLAPESKTRSQVPTIMSSDPISFPVGMGRFLEEKGVDLERLKFRAIRLVVKSIDGDHEFYFSLLGRRIDDKLVLQVTATAKNSKIKVGHVFKDINEAGQLVSDGSNHTTGHPVLSLEIEENN